MDRYDRLTSQLRGLDADLDSIGRSVEGRELLQVTFGDGPRRVLMTGALHGREWVAADFLLRLSEEFAEDFSYPRLRVTVVPLLNPDGVVAAETQQSRPHKERQKSNAHGVDLNRNFDAAWGTVGTDPEPDYIDGNYPGPAPFSEPETQAIRDVVIRDRPEVLIDWHCRGGLIDGFGPLGPELARLMSEENDYGVVREMHYPVSGSIGQWFRGQDPARTAVNIEIRTEDDLDWEPNRAATTAALTWLNDDAR